MWGPREHPAGRGGPVVDSRLARGSAHAPGVVMVRKFMLVALVALLALPAGAAILFQDSFETAPDDAWVIPNGGWQWDAGRFLNTSSCGFQSCMSPLFVGRPDWSDVTLKLDFTPTSGGVIYLMVGMTAPSLFEVGGSNGWLLDMGWGDHAGILYPSTPSGGPGVADDWTGLWHLSVGVTYTVEFGKQADQVFARFYPAGSAVPDWQLRGTDPRPSAGWCGFSTWHTTGYLDNVVVTGSGVVDDEGVAWGSVKSLFR